MTRFRLLACAIAGSVVLGCEDPPSKKAPESPPEAAVQPAPPKPSAPEGPPALVIDEGGPKVGFARVNMQYPDGRQKLAAELTQNRAHFEGKPARLAIDRKAQPAWVGAYLAELAQIGVSEVLVHTSSRNEYPTELRFTPETKVDAPPACSVVAMILADRGTAVWKLGGGVAGKRPKGMAGPDLSMTGETIERNAKACKQGTQLFVAGAPGIEWGLIYDLAASAYTLTTVRFDSRVFLGETPVPGHKVTLRR